LHVRLPYSPHFISRNGNNEHPVCAAMGLLWLSTVPPTNGICGGHVRYAVACHADRLCVLQPPGRRLSGCLARRARIRAHGSYDALWWLSILFGVLSGLINMPIVEKPIARLAATPA